MVLGLIGAREVQEGVKFILSFFISSFFVVAGLPHTRKMMFSKKYIPAKSPNRGGFRIQSGKSM